MGLTMEQIQRIELIYKYLPPHTRQDIVDAGDKLADLADKLWAMDMGCTAFRVSKALGELLDQPVVVQKAN